VAVHATHAPEEVVSEEGIYKMRKESNDNTLTLSMAKPWQLTNVAPAGAWSKLGMYWYRNLPDPPMIGAAAPSPFAITGMFFCKTEVHCLASSSNSKPHLVAQRAAEGKISQYSAFSWAQTSHPSTLDDVVTLSSMANNILSSF